MFSEFIRKIAEREELPWKAARLSLLLLLLIGSMKTLLEAWASLQPPLLVRKDFLQEYLIAAAYQRGIDIYQPVSLLTEQILGPQSVALFFHPTPHPPSLLPFIWPLASVSYQRAAAIWLVFESLLLVVLLLRMRSITGLARKGTFVLGLILLCSRPVYKELVLGQLSLAAAMLGLICVQAIENGHRIRAGIAIGVCMSIKLFGIPVLLYFLFKKRWRELGAAGLVFVLCNALFVVMSGFDELLRYYTTVGPSVVELYEQDEHNQSLWTIGTRLFRGLLPVAQQGITAPPLFRLPQFAPLLSFGLTVWAIGYFLRRALRFKDHLGVALMMILSAVVSPVAWVHGGVVQMAMFPFLYCYLRENGLLQKWQLAALPALLLLFIGDEFRDSLLGGRLQVTFWEGLLSAIPLVGMMCCCFVSLAMLQDTAKSEGIAEPNG